MPTLNLQAKTRAIKGKQVSQLRSQGEIPAVIYGHNIKPLNLTLNYSEFEKVFKQAGESTLISLAVDNGTPVKVLVVDVQFDHLKNRINHVDFHQVRMDEKLRANVILKFINEAPAVKELSGTLVTNIHELEVECLPNDLVHEIDIDLSSLKTFEAVIKVSDIKLPAGITIDHDPNDVVALVQEPRSEKELADLEAKPEESAPVLAEAAVPPAAETEEK